MNQCPAKLYKGLLLVCLDFGKHLHLVDLIYSTTLRKRCLLLSTFSGLQNTDASLEVAEYLAPIAWLVRVEQGLTPRPQVPYWCMSSYTTCLKLASPGEQLAQLHREKKRALFLFLYEMLGGWFLMQEGGNGNPFFSCLPSLLVALEAA